MMWRNKKTYIWKTKWLLSCHSSSNNVLWHTEPKWAWYSTWVRCICTRLEKRWAWQHEASFWHLLTNMSDSLLGSSAGVPQNRGHSPKLFSHQFMVDFHAVITVIGSSLCRGFRCCWIVSQWTWKAKRDYIIQSDLAAFGFRGIIAVYFTGFESCTDGWSCICSAQIW